MINGSLTLTVFHEFAILYIFYCLSDEFSVVDFSISEFLIISRNVARDVACKLAAVERHAVSCLCILCDS